MPMEVCGWGEFRAASGYSSTIQMKHTNPGNCSAIFLTRTCSAGGSASLSTLIPLHKLFGLGSTSRGLCASHCRECGTEKRKRKRCEELRTGSGLFLLIRKERFGSVGDSAAA